MKICPSCSATFNDDSVFCANCGSPLREQTVQYQPPIEVNPVAVPPVNTPGAAVGTQKKNNNPLIIVLIVVAVLLIAAIGTGVYFLLSSENSPLKNDEVVYEEQTMQDVVIQSEPETSTKAPESTTASFTSPAPDVVDNDKVYITFFNFYISYLDGINSLNPGMIDYCTPEVKSEMAERFQYNKKSLFDLSRIDYDVDSFTTVPNAISNEYSFYVKCVTRMYDRATLDEKDINYAVWKVTVTETNGNCVVSKMERDDKYKMGIHIETLDDDSSIF